MFKQNEEITEDTTTEDKGTSEETTTEEDTTTTDKGTSKEDEKGEESTDNSEDITKQYFTDPNSLDPKLRGAFKKMQGQFTKRMQEATLGIKKAQAFDQLVLDAEFRAWMEERHNRVTGKTTSRKETDTTEEDDSDDDTPITKSALRNEIQKALKPVLQEGTRKEQEAVMKKEAAQFREDHPDWEVYKDGILSLIERHPTLSYEEAYNLASRDDVKLIAKDRVIDAKKKANINKPNRVTGKTTDKKGKMTVREAFDQAKKSLGI